jgi:hypothetical protein
MTAGFFHGRCPVEGAVKSIVILIIVLPQRAETKSV